MPMVFKMPVLHTKDYDSMFPVVIIGTPAHLREWQEYYYDGVDKLPFYVAPSDTRKNKTRGNSVRKAKEFTRLHIR